MYQDRHNRIVDCLFNKISNANSECDVFKDKLLKPSMFDSNLEQFVHPHKRPDIVVIDKEQQLVLLTEVSVPYDCHFQTCFQSKFNKYFPLAQEINDLGFRTEIVILLIGSMGSVHSKFVSGLLKNNLNMSEAKFLAKFSSISACIGSFRVWKKKCSLLDN